MICCVIIALAFTLPVLLARKLFGAFGGGNHCSMAWRPAQAMVPVGPQVAVSFGVPVQGNARFSDDHFSVIGRVKSFGHAGRGAYRLLRFEHSAWIQMTLASAAVIAGLLLGISNDDWRWIVLMIGLVLSAEGLNTAIEKACDQISLEYSDRIKVAKDVAAGAVLLSSITAAVIGVQTLLPYVLESRNDYHAVLNCGSPVPGLNNKAWGV